MRDVHVVDTGVFVAMGRPSNPRFRAVRSFARRNEITFQVPVQVYEELSSAADITHTPPVETAIEQEWAMIADPVSYDDPFVSRITDGVRRYIANADDRPESQIERADVALAGTAASAFVTGPVEYAYIYTTDIAAGEGAETIFAAEGYADSVTFVNGFQLIADLLD